jgi:hypothetical protein
LTEVLLSNTLFLPMYVNSNKEFGSSRGLMLYNKGFKEFSVEEGLIMKFLLRD